MRGPRFPLAVREEIRAKLAAGWTDLMAAAHWGCDRSTIAKIRKGETRRLCISCDEDKAPSQFRRGEHECKACRGDGREVVTCYHVRPEFTRWVCGVTP